MPDADDPDGLVCDTIKKAIRGDADLSIGKVGEFWKGAARPGKPLEAAQHTLGPPSEPSGGDGIVPKDVRDRVEKLAPGGRREADPQPHLSASS